MKLPIKILHPELGKSIPLPRRMTPNAAGLDLCAAINHSVTLPSRCKITIPCGFAIEIPPNHEGQIRPRSSLAAEYAVTVLNSPGTIDADYRGEVKVLLINLGRKTLLIKPGDRIAQLVIAPVSMMDIVIQEELSETERGTGGFGSTNKNIQDHKRIYNYLETLWFKL